MVGFSWKLTFKGIKVKACENKYQKKPPISTRSMDSV